jgi:phosphoribosylformylglycinamidine synthase
MDCAQAKVMAIVRVANIVLTFRNFSRVLSPTDEQPDRFGSCKAQRVVTGRTQNPPMPVVRFYVTLKPALLDSAGRTLLGSLHKLGFTEVEDARIGKLIELKLTTYDQDKVKQMGDRLLANPVIEDYRVEVSE